MENRAPGILKVKVIIASQETHSDFYKTTLTGQSLCQQIHASRMELVLHTSNSTGLPKLYNAAIDASINDPCLLIFMHDDILILNYDWIDRIIEGLSVFDVLGVVGSKRRHPNQASWAYTDPDCQIREDMQHTSGYIGFGKQFPPDYIGIYGPSSKPVKLLDGLMICAYSDTLIKNELRFDERFDFHFYDLDFCREEEVKSLSCGTWPISLVHASLGEMNTPTWHESYATYLSKWKD